MTQMINTESISNGIVDGGAANPACKQGNDAQDKQAVKKTALKDVQNVAQNLHDSLNGGGSNKDNTVKVSGAKSPSTSPLYPAFCANEIMNANRRFDLELGSKANFQSSMSKFTSPQSRQPQQLPLETPDKKQTSVKANGSHSVPSNKPPANSSFSVLSGPNFVGKFSSGIQTTQADSAHVNISTDEQLRTERYIKLQKQLKECDEADYREYLEGLRKLSPAELNRHAQFLENRLYQLTVDNSNEMNRMRALNVLGKSSIPSNVPQATQQQLPRKC